MELKKISKKAQVSALPGFFQIMMLIVIFAGLTFIVVEKFADSIKTTATLAENSTAYQAVNDTQWALYDYAIGFLGIVILVVMVYLIISIVSGRGKAGAK